VTLGELQLLLDYHYWARDRALEAAGRLSEEQYSRELGSSFPSVRHTLVHTYSAEWVWYSRWQGHSPTAPVSVDSFPDVATLQSAWAELEAKVRSFLSELGDDGVTRQFEYATMTGQPNRGVFWQMLQHVVNHASYHRGQVTTMIRQMGAAPPRSMDLVTFHRERVPLE
jgi:uncharacterized damage-inducible protein DinB